MITDEPQQPESRLWLLRRGRRGAHEATQDGAQVVAPVEAELCLGEVAVLKPRLDKTADILWHTSPTMTHHYSMAQIVELHTALEKIKEDTGHWNKSLATLKLKRKRSGNPPSQSIAELAALLP